MPAGLYVAGALPAGGIIRVISGPGSLVSGGVGSDLIPAILISYMAASGIGRPKLGSLLEHRAIIQSCSDWNCREYSCFRYYSIGIAGR